MKKLILSILMFFFGKQINRLLDKYPEGSTPLNETLHKVGQTSKQIKKGPNRNYTKLRTTKARRRAKK